MGWSQIFLKISFEKAGLVEGESEFSGYEKQIVLLDFDWKMKAVDDVLKGKSVDRKAIRRINAEPMSLTKRFDISSTALCNAVAKRDLIKSARITVAQGFAVGAGAGGGLRDAFVVELTDAYLESVDLDMVADGKAMVLQEALSIRYSQIKVEVTPVDEKGLYVSNRKQTFIGSFKDGLSLGSAGA